MRAAARWLVLLLSISGLAARAASRAADYAQNIADLIAPEKLTTLRSRGANPRIQKAVAQLEAARIGGLKVEKAAADAVAGWGDGHGGFLFQASAARLRHFRA